ncbi:MAG: hypothetical protein ACT4QG_01085 [Sporichthyaceae bacterium]
MSLDVWLATLSLTHVGFQCVVTFVVYPALAATPAAAWPGVHAAHTRRMGWLVAPLYGALLIVCLAVLVRGPWTTATLAALAGNGLAGATTALVAGPAHGRLAKGLDSVVLARLLRADRVRLAGTLLAALGAIGVLA